MQQITIHNDYHNTAYTLHVRNGQITASQARRCRRALCGIPECTCGDWLGARGPYRERYGGYEIEQTGPYTGRVIGPIDD